MTTNVYFQWDNKVRVEVCNADGELLLGMEGTKEEVEQNLRNYLSLYEPLKAALAKLLYSPVSWD